MNEHGLGAIPSPLDTRDFPIEQLYALTGKEKLAPPANFRVPGQLNPILNQGSTPQCVAYSSAALKGTEDKIDQGQWYDWDENTFFVSIGGGPNGAITRNAFKQMLANGYPVKVIGDAKNHKIAAYYAVTPTLAEIQSALMAFGPLVFGMTWLNSMFSPKSNGVLTCDQSSGVGGGHAILCVGWIVVGGKTYVILRNSWGTSWGLSGEAYLPASAIASLVGEVWKAVDVIEKPPAPYTPRSTDMSTTFLTPVRILDTRTTNTPLQPGEDRVVQVTEFNGIPANVIGVSGDLAVVEPKAAGWLALTPTRWVGPSSNINFVPGQIVANGFTCGLNTDGTFSIHNGSLGTAHAVIDIAAYDLA
jgi:hypothetical protein